MVWKVIVEDDAGKRTEAVMPERFQQHLVEILPVLESSKRGEIQPAKAMLILAASQFGPKE
jgi:hypothetical protein